MKKIVAASVFLATGALGLGLAFSQMLSSGSATVDSKPGAETTASISPRTAPAPATGARVGDVPALPTVKVAQVASGTTGGAGATGAALPALPTLPAPALATSFPAVPGFPLAPQGATATAPADGQGPAVAPVASAPLKLPRAFRQAEVDGPYIAITFDDGPNPETTPKLLKMLADRQIKATFFVLGQRVTSSPEVTRAAAEAGHEIGNHSWSHPQLPKIGVAAVDKQIEDTNAAIEMATGRKTTILRPPYGAMNLPLQKHIEDKFGMSAIYWSVDPLDWKVRDPQAVYEQIMKQVRPGAVILVHDIHPTTVAAMPRVFDALLAKGYKFVTVSELMAMDRPPPPKVVAALTPGSGEPKKKAKPQQAAANPSMGGAGASGQAKKPAAFKPAQSVKPSTVSNGGALPPAAVAPTGVY